jgi:predicted RND superfamily exporter protein
MIAFLHLQFSNIRAIIVAVSANITRIVSYENEILRLKIAIFEFISLNAEKRRQSDELKQCLSRAVIAVLFANKNSYEDNFEFILNLIKVLQEKNVFIQTRFKDIVMSNKRQRVKSFCSGYTLNNEFLKFRDHYYVLDEKSLRAELLKRHHDDTLVNYLNVDKTIELLNRKYY